MKMHLAIAGMAVLSACGGGNMPVTTIDQPAVTQPGATTTAAVTADNAQFKVLLNQVRAANGAPAAEFSAQLAVAAQAHANDLLSNNMFSHTGSNGSSVGTRARAAGFAWRAIGENIAQGQTSEASVMASWTGSPGHHANNISRNFNQFGLGKAGSGSQTRWVLVLGAN